MNRRAAAWLAWCQYDIDTIINRTLVSGTLTAALVLTYFGSVAVFGELLRMVTDQEKNDLVIVVSTLGIAALFMPLRRNIQSVLDHRFYGRKYGTLVRHAHRPHSTSPRAVRWAVRAPVWVRITYDAARTLASFSASLRDEMDLATLIGMPLQVVNETMQPAHLSRHFKRAFQ